jgi:hypothetical protein
LIKDIYGNSRFYGVYRGIVVDNKDPLGKSRLQLQVPQIFAEQTTSWAWPVISAPTNNLPKIGEGIWVMFEGGDASFPIWIGTFLETSTTGD